MSGLPPPSAVSNIWSRSTRPTTNGPSMMGPTPFAGGNSFGLPAGNNLNFPSTTMPNVNNLPSTVSQPLRTQFPSLQQPLGPANGFPLNNSPMPNTMPSFNPYQPNLVQNLVRNVQNEANQRRLTQLEDENTLRRNTTMTLQQMGTHLLQGQMDVQEQVLQYQFMLDQCMETLDHQNFILKGQAEELTLLRAKMRYFEHFLDVIQQNKKKLHAQSTSGEPNYFDGNHFCFRNPLSLSASSISPLFTGGVTRASSSKFQPFNPRYRSPNSRPSNPNETRNIPSSIPNETRNIPPSIPNPTIANSRFSRPISNLNN